MSQARNYCFTLNNPTFKEMRALIMSRDYDYCIFGMEHFNQEYTDGGMMTPHLQGYMEFNTPKRIEELKYFPFDRMHLEKRKGSQSQAIEYCKKDSNNFIITWFEFGEKKKQGERNDLLHIKEMLDEGADLEDVAHEHFGDFTRYNFQKYVDVKKKFNYKQCDVMIYRGKDVYSWQDMYESTCFIGGDESINLYNGQECIVFTQGLHNSEVERFARNIPVTIKYGFQNREILPRYVIYCCPKFPKDSSFYDFVTEVSGVILSPDLEEGVIEES